MRWLDCKLWSGAAAAVLLVVFSVWTLILGVVSPTPPVEITFCRKAADGGKESVTCWPPVNDDRVRHKQVSLILHFRTSCPQCFRIRVRSTYWTTSGDQQLVETEDPGVARFVTRLIPKPGATGDAMRSSVVEIQRTRGLPLLPLPPEPVEAVTFERLNNMAEQEARKYDAPHDY